MNMEYVSHNEIYIAIVEGANKTNINVVKDVIEKSSLAWYAICYDKPDSIDMKILFSLYSPSQPHEIDTEFRKICYNINIFKAGGSFKDFLPWLEAPTKIVLIPPFFPRDIMEIWQGITPFKYVIHGHMHRNIKAGESMALILTPSIFSTIISHKSIQILGDDGIFRTSKLPNLTRKENLMICSNKFMKSF